MHAVHAIRSLPSRRCHRGGGGGVTRTRLGCLRSEGCRPGAELLRLSRGVQDPTGSRFPPDQDVRPHLRPAVAAAISLSYVHPSFHFMRVFFIFFFLILFLSRTTYLYSLFLPLPFSLVLLTFLLCVCLLDFFQLPNEIRCRIAIRPSE